MEVTCGLKSCGKAWCSYYGAADADNRVIVIKDNTFSPEDYTEFCCKEHLEEWLNGRKR